MPEQTVKCLSIRQPWAHLIMSGKKIVEFRSWSTDYRGPLLIHAAQKFVSGTDYEHLRGSVAHGVILGTVDLYDCKPSWYSVTGEFYWKLRNPRRFAHPIPYRGQQHLFNVPCNLLPKSFRP
jgi:hypothetical protein